MSYIVHRASELKSVLHLEITCRLTMGGLAKVMREIIQCHPPKKCPMPQLVSMKDFRRGVRVMEKLADLRISSVTISNRDAYHALLVCAYLSNFSAALTSPIKAMLRETLMIFAACSPVGLKVAYVLPFDALDAEVQKIPVVMRHYPSIEAKASMALEAYPLSLTDAMDLLDALNGSRTIRMALLLQALRAATEGIREILANITGRKP